MQKQLAKILSNVPKSWLGTTFPNDSRFVGRDWFLQEMDNILSAPSREVYESELARMFPTDYVRLGSPLSCLLEVVRSKEMGLPARNVFSFSSPNLPLISVMLASTRPVHIYSSSPLSLRKYQQQLKEFFRFDFKFLEGAPRAAPGAVVVHVTTDMSRPAPFVDAVVNQPEGFLYVCSPGRICVDDVKDAQGNITLNSISTLRKRLGGAATTPDVLALLQRRPLASAPDTAALKQHLKHLGGVADAPGDVLLGTTGLAALSTAVLAASHLGQHRVDLLMCSTAYGGSAQQADILTGRAQAYTKHTFDIQGGRPVFQALQAALRKMRGGPRKPLTLVQLEYPTNPDMKDCSLLHLEEELLSYQADTGTQVVLLFDTTFSPVSQVAKGMFTHIAVIVFNSLSKSVSGGFTTGGSLVANKNPLAQRMLAVAHDFLDLMGTEMKPCQLQIMAARHGECEGRVAAAHKNAVVAAQHLETTVFRHSAQSMKVNFVTPSQIAKKVTPATFSFNLPAPAGASPQQLEGLAQAFVDGLVAAYPEGIKPCVSFGQKNSLVYVTVPATSTQGVLSAEVKAKQAIGGVQLVRFSFPPTMDRSGWQSAVAKAVQQVYNPNSKL